jgi:hypothetical protein
MRPLTIDELSRLLHAGHTAPCVSIYLPTHRHHPGTEQDPIRYRGLLGLAGELLRTRYRGKDVNELLAPLEALSDREFWQRQLDGLAVFRSAEAQWYFQLPMQVPELAIVADTFHTRPLVHMLRSNRHYFVLAISANEVSLFEGSPWGLAPLDLRDAPAGMRAALGVEAGDRHVGMHSASAGGGRAVFHGRGPGREQHKEKLAKYFQVIDRALWAMLRDERAPLVLAGVGYYHPIYRGVSRYPYLLDSGVEGHVDRDSIAQLHERAWPLVQEQFAEREREILDAYGSSAAAGRASDDPATVARAAVYGRVRTLLIDESQHLWGRLDRESGALSLDAEQRDAVDADVLDDLSEVTLLRGGEVIMLPRERMPTTSPAAAVFRF